MTRGLPTFKAGQKWRTRGGNVVTVAYVVAPLSDQAYIVTTDEGCSYTSKGHYHISGQEHYLDLVTLVSDGDADLAVEEATTTPLHILGTLKTNAEVRTHLCPGTLRVTPALRIELEHIKGTVAYSVVLTVPCTSYSDAQTRAKNLLKGRVIDFDARAEDAYVLFPTVQEINIY